MSKITLEVNDKHLSEVLIILKSLKNGMITTLNVENKSNALKEKYKEPVVKSAETLSSRYISPEQFKQKLKEKK